MQRKCVLNAHFEETLKRCPVVFQMLFDLSISLHSASVGGGTKIWQTCDLIIMISRAVLGLKHRRDFKMSAHPNTHMWHFAMLTNTDGKTHAVLLIMYEWHWRMENNVIKVGLHGWQECTRGNQWWGEQRWLQCMFHKIQFDGFLRHARTVWYLTGLSQKPNLDF